jgi:signal transduction histidine kinase
VHRRPHDAEAAALAIEGTGREAVNELRGLLGVLRRGDEEVALAPQPSLARLQSLVDNARAAGFAVELEVHGDPAPLPRGEELAAYRIVQEALTNVFQHAGDTRAEVVLHYEPGALEITVDDGGVAGATRTAPAHEGHGLVGMRERVTMYGGSFEAGPREDGGWRVHARLPCERVVTA